MLSSKYVGPKTISSLCRCVPGDLQIRTILTNSDDFYQLWIFGPQSRHGHGARVGYRGKAPGEERQERNEDQCCGHILPQAPQWGLVGQC